MSRFIELLQQGSIRWRDLHDVEVDDRPRLIFAGSGLDHWSAALAATINTDLALAGALSELYTCVALEVAAEPQFSATIQQALQLTAGATGWPVLAICTPDGDIFGAVGWRRIDEITHLLLQAAEAWQRHPADCQADAARLAAAGNVIRAPAQGRPLRAALVLDAAEAAAMAIADSVEGGFGSAPRTVEPGLWGFLVQRAARENAPLALQQQVERSLAAWCAGAAHDHLAGGFFAGCSDANWRTPACAKRLSDQAQQADLLVTAGTLLGNPLWHDIALRALRWTCVTLRHDTGTFAHGLQADSPAAPGRWEEGACYRWSAAAVAEIVGEAGATLVSQRFDLPAEGEGFLAVGEALSVANQRRLPELVNRLAAARSERPQPRRDESVYPLEQAQMALALEHIAVVEPEFVAAADALFAYLTSPLVTLTFTRTPTPTTAAWVGRALAARWRRTGIPQPLALRCAALDVEGDLDPIGGLSPAAVLGHLRLDIAELTGDSQWFDQVDHTLSNARDRLRAAPLACAGLLSVLDRRTHSQP